MSNILMLPMHVDALYLTTSRSVVGPMADFSQLPYTDGTQEYNADVANLSEEIVSHPFQDRSLQLKPGMHLHWSLPDGLTKGTHDTDGITFPSIPNRWLITRSGDGKIKQWIVESNYLYPEGSSETQGSITFPVEPAQGDYQRYRSMGRTTFLAVWEENDSAPTGLWSEPDLDSTNVDYYHDLTAVGYGESTFAAFYPNCQSILGFYDNDYVDQTPPDSLQYDIVGWYGDSDKDPLQSSITVTDTDDIKYQTLADEFGWTVSDESQSFPGRDSSAMLV